MYGATTESIIETARLILRRPRADDAERIVAAINDVDVARMTTGIPHPYTLAHAEAYLAHQDRREPNDHALQIETRDGEMIGGAGAHALYGPLPEIGYWIARSHWGRGYGAEAALALRDWAAQTFRARAVMAGHFIDNPASGRVLVKAGFLYTGAVERRFSMARGCEVETRMMVWLG